MKLAELIYLTDEMAEKIEKGEFKDLKESIDWLIDKVERKSDEEGIIMLIGFFAVLRECLKDNERMFEITNSVIGYLIVKVLNKLSEKLLLVKDLLVNKESEKLYEKGN